MLKKLSKKSFIIISISLESFDYDLLLNYLCVAPFVTHLYVMPEGFLAEIETSSYERKKFIGTIIQSEIKNIEIHDILYEKNRIKA